MKDKIQNWVKDAIAAIWGEGFAPAKVNIEKPKSAFGDFALNIAFILAKQLSKSPAEIAKELEKKLNQRRLEEIEKIEVVNNYINLFLSQKYLQTELTDIGRDKNFGHSDVGKGWTVIIEYSQPNIAKKMHIGHLRNTVLGDALARIYKFLGFRVVRWNYLGDWGTQFGKLIAAYKLWGDKSKIERNPIQELLDLYIRFNQEAKENAELDKRGQEEFKKLEGGDQENLKLWQWFKEESLKEFEKIYKLLGVEFDEWIGESFYEKRLKGVVEDLKKRGIAQEGEGGSTIVNLDNFNLPPALIQKSDGASLYLTRDIANIEYRLKNYNPYKILYVVGNEQSLHFQQLFAIAGMTGLDQAELEHVKYGLVLGEDKKKLATREGKTIFAEDVINKAQELAKKIIEEKNPELENKEEVASAVAIGALKYELLKDGRTSDIVFDWKRMLNFSGQSGPYLQYTYARLNNILEKAKELVVTAEPDFGLLQNEAELNIIKQLIEFPDTVVRSQETNSTNHLALYLYELANLANQFYETVPVLKEQNQSLLSARLTLVQTVAKIVSSGLNLLGITAVDRI